MGVDAEMVVVAPVAITDRALLRLSYETCCAFGHRYFWTDREGVWGEPHHALSLGTEYNLTPPPPPGTTFRVRLWMSYYGPGYERGDPAFLLALARWFRSKLPGSVIYYGSDTGLEIEELTEDREREMWEHFVANQHFPYIRHGSMSGDSIPTPHCELCDEDLIRNGWGGGNFGAFYCPGCGWTQETRDTGKTWTERKERVDA